MVQLLCLQIVVTSSLTAKLFYFTVCGQIAKLQRDLKTAKNTISSTMEEKATAMADLEEAHIRSTLDMQVRNFLKFASSRYDLVLLEVYAIRPLPALMIWKPNTSRLAFLACYRHCSWCC